ncbi:hypothetical protein ROLI_005620 [Roseobacter fucihabitans]|uniref:HTH IS408-type domain-containing protein n=1 Tax=Roseobacter fucihabitans TaxID=1537242 RepID=A0ABZ2BN86_9RHOB|nr:transposase [Roseobacter litoralis]MBC6964735.1 hypothetical protein [Roseobacter litoralis]
MRKIREALRLSHGGLSTRVIASSLGVGRTTLREYLSRARDVGLSWPLSSELTDAELEQLLFPPRPVGSSDLIPLPGWAYVHAELRRKGVTLLLLWEEYREVRPEGYGYSRYCELYTRWEGKLSPVMRQRHPAGERLFVDYAGHTVDVVDPQTGEVRTAQIFVATFGANRRALFETLDKPALKPLPREPYVYAEWKKCRAGLDYHVDIERHYCSVPHQLLRQELWACITARIVEIYHKGQRVAAHQRISGNCKHSTIRDHMPANHRYQTDWTPERIRTQAARIGPNVETFVEMVMRKRRHPEQGYRTCMGVLRLAKTFGAARLDAARDHTSRHPSHHRCATP